MLKLALRALAAPLVVFAAIPTLACSIPVFRYSLQFWEPDPYEAIVFHRGALSAEDEAAVAALEARALSDAGEGAANVAVRRVDLTSEGDVAEVVSVYEKHGAGETPVVVLRFPPRFRTDETLAVAKPGELAEAGWFDSPARQTIAERLAAGESAVWVLLESGNTEKDDAAHARLEDRLKHLTLTLKLPEQLAEDDDLREEGLAVDAPLRLAFSTLRVSRKDPAEAILVRTLLHSEDDLLEFEEPMAFAVFGRGRVLPGLIGAGINSDTIDDAAAFVTGPCSCQVKEENPGVDLLTGVDWKTLLARASLASDPSIKGTPLERIIIEEPPESAPPRVEGSASTVATATSEEQTTSAPSAAQQTETKVISVTQVADSFVRWALYAAAFVAVLIVAGAMFFRGRGVDA